MAGLLDSIFNTEGGRMGLGLLGAGSARGDGAGFGQRLNEAVGSVDQWKKQQAAAEEAKQMQAYKAMQMQQMQAQFEQQKQEQEQAATDMGAVRSAFTPMSGGSAMSNGQGPTLANAGNIGQTPQFDPRQFLAQNPQASLGALKQAMELNSNINPAKKFGFHTVDGNLVRTDDAGGASSVFSAAPKPADPNKPFTLGVNGEFVPNTAYQEYEIKKAASGASKMSVNTSDPTALAKAGMDFQDKYRGATKDSFSRAQAFEAMTEASKNPSAKGDLTMVYSMVKALDPTSVVREGEISLLNANRSIPDSIKGYAQRLATGQSLLPKEREDMLKQAQSLIETDYRRSRNDIKAYRDNATRLTLDPELYAPDPYTAYEKSKSPKANNQNIVSELPKTAAVGARVKDTVTGKIMRFDGMKWKDE